MGGWLGVVRGILEGEWLAAPRKKVFKAKFELPELRSYKGAGSGAFWGKFPVNRELGRPEMLKAGALVELAHEVGCGDWDRLWTVCRDIKYGADIGCRGPSRMATVSSNAPSAAEFGRQVSDAVADWVKKGFAAGPYGEEEVPAAAKISGIMCREKPNGSVRIILNLSAPKGVSVNDGINSDDFPASMSSTQKWLEVLDKAGPGALMVKIDWSDAYKHLAVREEDRDLQWFQWLDKFFVELCLIFGSSSSVGIYDRTAKAVLDLVCRLAKFPPDMACQHLDDVVAAAAKGSGALWRFDAAYKEVAERVGVKLAPRDDPEKSFSPRTTGVVFGVWYDTVAWTWGIPGEKMAKIGEQIGVMLEAREARQDEIQSIVGRIVNVRALVPDGRFHVHHLLSLVARSELGSDMVELTVGFKGQLHFWYVMLRACSGRASIPAPAERLPPWAVDCFTDAAGGTLEGPGRGVGAVVPGMGWWAYMPWSVAVNSGKWVTGGKKMSRKMAALELVGPLLAIVAGAEVLRGGPVRMWVDNSGSCSIWKHGYSGSCKISTTVVRAIAAVAAALGCKVDICKITRCSTSGAEMADAVSKADFGRFRRAGGGELAAAPAVVPVELLRWAAAPVEDDDLGGRLLEDLAQRMMVLGRNC